MTTCMLVMVSQYSYHSLWMLCIGWLTGLLAPLSELVQMSISLIFIYFFILFFNFTILYWFCHTSKWIRHRYTCVPHPEPSSLLPPHSIPRGHPSAPAPSIQYRASNLDWWLVSYMILYMFQCQRFSKIIYCKTVTSSIVLLKFQSIQSISDHYIPSSVKNYPNTTEKFSKCCKLIYVVEAKDSP